MWRFVMGEARPWSPPKTYADVWGRYWDKVKGVISYEEARRIHQKWAKIGSSL
jgi:hypothetical protein